ncbi:MAG: metalloregulator ArsR/SmtB family transcription factor [Anaerorhabdus sp.]|uniref:ArsR/SmtB family transcription factor n=1 Tax=Anaerorhabdus sp. TaxID=1872524 RepID=UPI002FCBCF6C
MNSYQELSKVLKALSDPKRLEIIDMLSCGELCACDIQEHFDITQPTLSHDLKVLYDANLLNTRSEGKWKYYSLNVEYLDKYQIQLSKLFLEKKNCICKK